MGTTRCNSLEDLKSRTDLRGSSFKKMASPLYSRPWLYYLGIHECVNCDLFCSGLRPWVLARMTDKEYCQAKKVTKRPYSLSRQLFASLSIGSICLAVSRYGLDSSLCVSLHIFLFAANCRYICLLSVSQSVSL